MIFVTYCATLVPSKLNTFLYLCIKGIFSLCITLYLHREEIIFGETASFHLKMTGIRVLCYSKVSSLTLYTKFHLFFFLLLCACILIHKLLAKLQQLKFYEKVKLHLKGFFDKSVYISIPLIIFPLITVFILILQTFSFKLYSGQVAAGWTNSGKLQATTTLIFEYIYYTQQL